jgi:hypothetical protein
LLEGADDWVPRGAVYDWTKRLAGIPTKNDDEQIVAALTERIGDGLIVCGEVINDRGFVAINDPAEKLFERSNCGWLMCGPEEFLLWLATRQSGDAVAGRLSGREVPPGR